MRKLFLDDIRFVEDCVPYMSRRIGEDKAIIYYDPDWRVVRNYPQFVTYIYKEGMPDLISFDHDLAEGHYHQNMQEGKINYDSNDFHYNDMNKTGYHCAKFLIGYCEDNNIKLPEFIVHSMNPVGTQNIESLLNNYKKHQDARLQ